MLLPLGLGVVGGTDKTCCFTGASFFFHYALGILRLIIANDTKKCPRCCRSISDSTCRICQAYWHFKQNLTSSLDRTHPKYFELSRDLRNVLVRLRVRETTENG